MHTLDNQSEIEKIDTGKILASIRMLPDQMEQAWEDIKTLAFPRESFSVTNAVVAGMGGSALGGRIVDSLIEDRVRMPIEIFTQYSLPNYVNSNTLVLVTTYSGNTEEALSMAKQAIARKARVIGITSGGELAEYFHKEKIPVYKFNPKANPSGQPRMGLGYSVAATLALLAKGELIHLSNEEFYEVVVDARNFSKEYDLDVESTHNLAKSLALKLHSKVIALVSSGHLGGVAHAFKNQLNENSKNFSVGFEIPELNHHLMEGLKYPAKLHGLLHFLFIESEAYEKRIQKRYPLTQAIVEKNGHETSVIKLRSEKKLIEIFEMLVLGSYISFYLALLNDVDPNTIPYVDYFKHELSKLKS